MDIQRFKDTADERNISNKDIIKCLGINESTYYRRLARGNHIFSVEEAQKLSKLLKLTKTEAREIFLG